MDPILDLIQLLPDHHIVPIAVRILPVVAQDIRAVSVVRASLLSLIALSPTKVPICSDILREMQKDSRIFSAELPFWAAVAQEPGSPLGTSGVFSAKGGEKDASLLEGTSKEPLSLGHQSRKKGAAALLKGLKNGEVSKLVDGMEAQVEASDAKKLAGERVAEANLSEHTSKHHHHHHHHHHHQQSVLHHKQDALETKKHDVDCPQNSLRSGELPKLVNGMPVLLQPEVCDRSEPRQDIDNNLPAFGTLARGMDGKSPQSATGEQEFRGLNVKKKGAAALLKGMRTGEVSKLVDDMEANTQVCLDKRYSFADRTSLEPEAATFADFWKHFEDMPMLDRFTISVQEEELKKIRQSGSSSAISPRSGWISREVELEGGRKELRTLMNQGVQFQLDLDPSTSRLG